MKSPMALIMGIWAQLNYWLGAVIFLTGMGRWHIRLHDFSMARLQRAADIGQGQALLLIGQLLKYRGVSVYHRQAGVGYLRSAAQQGSTDAMFMLAEALCDKSLQLTHEDEDVLTLYKQAAQQGHTMAALRLKKAYTDGLWGVAADAAQASYWSEQFMKSSNK